MIKYRNNKRHGRWIIWLSFLIALLLQIVPYTNNILTFRPNWVLLILFYWILTVPHYIGISTGFAIGIILDIVNNTTLGVHAFSTDVIIYLSKAKLQYFHKIMIWQQALFVMLLSISTDIIIFWIEFLAINISFRPEVFFTSIVNGILWPELYFVMRNISNRFSIQ